MLPINPNKINRPFEELFLPGCPWYDARETYGQPDIKWCERTQCSIITEPVNTWSNISYLVIAVLILRSKIFSQKKMTWLFALIVSLMAVCSFIYHATNNALSQMLDFFGIFGFVFLIVSINLIRLKLITKTLGAILTVTASVGLPLVFPLLYQKTIHVQFTVGVAVLALFATEGALFFRNIRPRSFRPFLYSVCFFSIATFFTAADAGRLICQPDNRFIQPHALWHLFGSVGIYFAARHIAQLEEQF